jgi:hypothetical protein
MQRVMDRELGWELLRLQHNAALCCQLVVLVQAGLGFEAGWSLCVYQVPFLIASSSSRLTPLACVL